MDMYEERDDKRRPQVSGLCLKAFGRRGGGLGSPEAYCARFYFGSHVFWSLAIWRRRIRRQSRSLRRSGAKVETDL